MDKEIIFTCLRCQANWTVPEETDECPVCFWKRRPAKDTSKRDRFNRECAYRMC